MKINIVAAILNGIAAIVWTINALDLNTWQCMLPAILHGILAITNIY